MFKTALLALIPLGLVFAVPKSEPAPAAFGAPWLSLELPANPMDASTRSAVMVVRAYYHGNPARFTPVGTAEGLVDGKRQSIPLEIVEAAQPGAYAIKRNWPSQGRWILNVGMQGQEGPSLVVELGANGGVTAGKYYEYASTSIALNSVRVIDRKLDARQIEVALKGQ